MDFCSSGPSSPPSPATSTSTVVLVTRPRSSTSSPSATPRSSERAGSRTLLSSSRRATSAHWPRRRLRRRAVLWSWSVRCAWVCVRNSFGKNSKHLVSKVLFSFVGFLLRLLVSTTGSLGVALGWASCFRIHKSCELPNGRMWNTHGVPEECLGWTREATCSPRCNNSSFDFSCHSVSLSAVFSAASSRACSLEFSGSSTDLAPSFLQSSASLSKCSLNFFQLLPQLFLHLQHTKSPLTTFSVHPLLQRSSSLLSGNSSSPTKNFVANVK